MAIQPNSIVEIKMCDADSTLECVLRYLKVARICSSEGRLVLLRT